MHLRLEPAADDFLTRVQSDDTALLVELTGARVVDSGGGDIRFGSVAGGPRQLSGGPPG